MQSRPIQRFFGDDHVKLISIPSIAAAYNLEMNAVDRGDQLRSYWGPNRRVRRGGWKALAWDFLLEIALINSFLLQLRGLSQWKPESSQKSWRQRLVDDLIAAYATQSQARQRFRTGDEFTPVLQHNWVRNKNPSACRACKNIRLGEGRSRQLLQAVSGNSRPNVRKSRYQCKQYDVALYRSGNCWDFYHHLK